jgi:hypothetical protein
MCLLGNGVPFKKAGFKIRFLEVWSADAAGVTVFIAKSEKRPFSRTALSAIGSQADIPHSGSKVR